MQPITEALLRVELGSPVQFLNLTFIPLLVADGSTPSYTMLDEARQAEIWDDISIKAERLNTRSSTNANVTRNCDHCPTNSQFTLPIP